MKKFYYQGLEFLVPVEVENYAMAIKRNISFQDQAQIEFRKKYQQYGDMDQTITHMEDDLYHLFGSVITSYVDALINKGYYELSTTSFMQEYYTEASHIEYACSKICDAYNEIVMTKKQQEEYRRLRKASRGRWQGGGFGIGGAVKGAALAGTANIITGAGHTVFNAIGNIGSSIAASGKKRKLYNDPNTLNTLLTALRSDIFGIIKAYVTFMERNTECRYTVRYTNVCNEVQNILNNIKQRNLDEDEFRKVIYKAFEKDPYNPDIYTLLLHRYGDDKNELSEITELFGCTNEVEKEKTRILEEVVSKVNVNTLEDSEQLIQKLDQVAQKYGVTEENVIIKNARKQHDELYDKARTFDGILYDTIEQAETAQKEKAELDEIMVGYDPANLDVMKKKQREIESKQLTVYNKEEYLKKIEIDIENYDQSLRTVQGVTYDTLDEANLAKKEQEIVESIISNINEKNQEDILRDIDKINAQKFSHINPEPYIKKCYKRLEEYKVNGIWNQIKDMLIAGNYKEAIYLAKNNDLSVQQKKGLMDKLNTEINFKFSKEKKMAEEYTSLSSMMLGGAVIIVIGWFLQSYFSKSFVIAVGIVVLAFFGHFMNIKENYKNKEAYELIKVLKDLGYEI